MGVDHIHTYIYICIAHAALTQVNTSSHIRDPTKTKGLLEGLGVYKNIYIYVIYIYIYIYIYVYTHIYDIYIYIYI